MSIFVFASEFFLFCLVVLKLQNVDKKIDFRGFQMGPTFS